MGTEDWIFKGTKLITHTKKQRLKIQGRGQTLKNTIKKITRIIKKNTYMKFTLKIKMKIKGVVKNLKIF